MSLSKEKTLENSVLRVRTMDRSFWQERWSKNEIAFHLKEVNPSLVKYFNQLALPKSSRIFLPLCGKTLDISWLLANGYHVVGVELSSIAIEQLFAQLGVQPKISKVGELELYSANNIDIFIGDIFSLTEEILGQVDAVYDRAALVALTEELRFKYSKHLVKITTAVQQLLICYVYDQELLAGPPFSVNEAEVMRHYQTFYNLTKLEVIEIPGGLKGKCEATEEIWLLNKIT